MRIGFDLSPTAGFGSPGVRAAAEGLWRALEQRGQHEWVALTPQPGQAARRWRQWELPRRAGQLGLEGLHLTVSALPLWTRLPRLQTVHELPWLHGVEEGSDRSHRLWLQLGRRLAAQVLTPSEQTRLDWQREFPGAPRTPALVPWGGAEQIEALDPGWAREAVERRLGLRCPYLLVLGGTRPKKRLLELIAAQARWDRTRQRCLVVSGPASAYLEQARAQAQSAGLELVHVEGRLGTAWPAAELSLLLSGALALLAMARSEGFGLPLLQALAAGTPAIAAAGAGPDRTFAPRILTADMAAPPNSAQSLDAALERALAMGPEQRALNRACALPFTWARAAGLVDALWERRP